MKIAATVVLAAALLVLGGCSKPIKEASAGRAAGMGASGPNAEATSGPLSPVLGGEG
jgi:hypothetical protein